MGLKADKATGRPSASRGPEGWPQGSATEKNAIFNIKNRDSLSGGAGRTTTKGDRDAAIHRQVCLRDAQRRDAAARRKIRRRLGYKRKLAARRSTADAKRDA